jgi:hypothetical protein
MAEMGGRRDGHRATGIPLFSELQTKFEKSSRPLSKGGRIDLDFKDEAHDLQFCNFWAQVT